MAQKCLRKYGASATINFTLWENDGIDFKVDAVHVAGDTTIMKDEGAEASTTNSFTDEGTGYSLVLTATEMQAARIVIYIVDQGTKAWLDDYVVIETYGNASAQHAMDLDDSVRAGLTALPNAAADAAGGLPISDAGGLDLDAMNTNINDIETDTGTTIPGTITTLQTTADNIETDTQDLQTQIGTAGAGLTDLGGMSTGMKAEVNAEADTALTDYDPPTKTELDTAFTEIKGATWSGTTDTLEHIRDKETDIETDTQDLQTQVGTAGAGLTDLGGMSTGMKAEVNVEADTALTDYDPPTRTEATSDKDEIITDLDDVKGTGFVKDTDSLVDLTHIAGTKGSDNIHDDLDAVKTVTDNLPNSGALTDIDTGVNNIEAKLPSGTISDFDETADPVELLDTGGTAGTSASELVADVDADLTSSHGAGAWTSAAGTDWTATEKASIRAVLGVDALTINPAAVTVGALKTIDDAIGTVDTVADAIKAVTDNLPNSGALTDIDTGVNAIEAKLPSGTISDFDETTDPVEVLDTGGSAGTSASELVADIDADLTSSHGAGAWTTAAGTDWTATEKASIRAVLGVDALTINPAAVTIGALKTIDDAITTVDTVVDAIKVKTDALPSGMQKNTAFSNFQFPMIDSTDDVTYMTGLTVTGERLIDNGSFTALDNSASIAEVANGFYRINLTAADLNGDIVTLRFTAVGANNTTFTFKLES